MLLIFIILMLILVYGLRKDLKIWNGVFFKFLTVASIAYWAYVVITMLNTDLVCNADDQLCNSGNTFYGDFTWGTLWSFMVISVVWALALVAKIVVDKLVSKKPKKSKKLNTDS